MSHPTLSTRQWLMALCIVTIGRWNFGVSKVGLRGGVPPPRAMQGHD